jgi:hypothetical protein
VHLANSKLCPNQKKKSGNGGDALVNGTWQNEDDKEFNMFATRADNEREENYGKQYSKPSSKTQTYRDTAGQPGRYQHRAPAVID